MLAIAFRNRSLTGHGRSSDDCRRAPETCLNMSLTPYEHTAQSYAPTWHDANFLGHVETRRPSSFSTCQSIRDSYVLETFPKKRLRCISRMLDLQLAGCELNSRPRRCRLTTLGKLFTPTCLGRSQWFSDGMIGCGVRGRGQLCLSRQPLRYTALGTGCAPFLQCLGRLSLPPFVGR